MNLIGRMRLTLKTGATVFGLSAVLLLLLPDFFLELLALESNPELVWSMRMIGVTLIALTGNMYVVVSAAPDAGVTRSAKVMLIAAGGLGILTLAIPAELNWFSIAYAAVGFGFSAMYGTLLLLASRSR
ncbi:MAG: hypothetical protein RIT32_250 [Actinomycetota bacterium]|jgi:uncharacterized membrane protein